MNNKLRSIYNKQSYDNAINPKKQGQYGITFSINPTNSLDPDYKPIQVTGILKESIGWSVNANWGETGTFKDIIQQIATSNPVLGTLNSFVDTVNDLSGRSFVNSGLFTRKFYKTGSDLSISPSFRVMDFDNSGDPINAALLFTSMCLPRRKESASDKVVSEQLEAPATALGTFMDAAGTKLIESADKLKLPIARLVGDAVGKGITGLGNTTKSIPRNLAGTSLNWTMQPETVDVQVGSWLSISGMVLLDVSVKYSTEMTTAGPLYADFDLKLATRENLTFNDNGQIDQLKMNTNGEVGVEGASNAHTGTSRVFGVK